MAELDFSPVRKAVEDAIAKHQKAWLLETNQIPSVLMISDGTFSNSDMVVADPLTYEKLRAVMKELGEFKRSPFGIPIYSSPFLKPAMPWDNPQE